MTMKKAEKNNRVLERADVYRLAAASELDVRTIKKALARGVASLRAHVDQTRLRDAAKELRLYVPESVSETKD
jgi:hypothetical protein